MKNQANKTEEKTFTVNEVGTLIERFDDKLDLVLETMDIKFNGVYERLDKVENRLDGVENRLDLVEIKIDRLQDDIVEVKYEFKQKASNEDFKKLEKRVTKLERLSLAQ